MSSFNCNFHLFFCFPENLIKFLIKFHFEILSCFSNSSSSGPKVTQKHFIQPYVESQKIGLGFHHHHQHSPQREFTVFFMRQRVSPYVSYQTKLSKTDNKFHPKITKINFCIFTQNTQYSPISSNKLF